MEERAKRKTKFLHYTYTVLIQNGRMHSSMWGWEHTSRFTPYFKPAVPCENRTDTDSCYVPMDQPAHLSNINKQLRLLYWNSRKEANPQENIPNSAKISVTLQTTKTRQKSFFPIQGTLLRVTQEHIDSVSHIDTLNSVSHIDCDVKCQQILTNI